MIISNGTDRPTNGPVWQRNGCRIYVDIKTREKLFSIKVANMDINYWSVSSSSMREEDWVKAVDRYFSQLQVALYQST